MVPAQSGCRRDTVEQRHVQIEDDSIRDKSLRELDRREPVRSDPGHRELGLTVDQALEGPQKGRIVVGDQDANLGILGRRGVHFEATLALPR